MSSERTIEASHHVTAADHDSEENLPFWLAVILHLLPGALLMGAVLLLLAPPLIERGVPYEVAHIASAMLTMVPFMFGAMLLHGRAKHGRLTLRGMVLFRRPMPLWQYAALYVPMLTVAFASPLTPGLVSVASS